LQKPLPHASALDKVINLQHKTSEQSKKLTLVAKADLSAVVSWTIFACSEDRSFLLVASSSLTSDNSATFDWKQANTFHHQNSNKSKSFHSIPNEWV